MPSPLGRAVLMRLRTDTTSMDGLSDREMEREYLQKMKMILLRRDGASSLSGPAQLLDHLYIGNKTDACNRSSLKRHKVCVWGGGGCVRACVRARAGVFLTEMRYLDTSNRIVLHYSVPVAMMMIVVVKIFKMLAKVIMTESIIPTTTVRTIMSVNDYMIVVKIIIINTVTTNNAITIITIIIITILILIVIITLLQLAFVVWLLRQIRFQSLFTVTFLSLLLC